MIPKLKNRYVIKIALFLEGVDTDNVLLSNKIFSSEKGYKYFIGYLDDNLKIKLLHIMLPKTSVYVKSYDGETKCM